MRTEKVDKRLQKMASLEAYWLEAPPLNEYLVGVLHELVGHKSIWYMKCSGGVVKQYSVWWLLSDAIQALNIAFLGPFVAHSGSLENPSL